MPTRADTLLQRLEQKAKRGHRGDPVATVALYGPDDLLASKLVVGFSPNPDSGIVETQAWSSDDDVRSDAAILEEALAFISERQVRSVVMTAGILGCPHEEGIDYPEGEHCELCTFWIGRERNAALIG